MDTNDAIEEATDVLRQLGLKEYEAQCFVGLSRLSEGTAKQLSEITDVPRTRVYDAVRVLELYGLVEVQHSSPQLFRAVPLEEAVETLRAQYESRVERLKRALGAVDVVETDGQDTIPEVWGFSGTDAIRNRTTALIDAATEDVALVIGDESLLSEELLAALAAVDDDIDVLIGTVTGTLEERVHEALPDARSFVSGLEWLRADGDTKAEVAIGRLLLVDGSTLLVSTIDPVTKEEHAVYSEGLRNGLVVISRRLMAQGLGVINGGTTE